MILVYKSSNGEVVENTGTNSLFPNGIPDETSIIQNVVNDYGGTASDYDVIRLHDIGDVEIVNKTFTHEYIIQNKQVVFGTERVIPEPEPQPPTETELLTDYIIDVDYRVTMIELGV